MFGKRVAAVLAMLTLVGLLLMTGNALAQTDAETGLLAFYGAMCVVYIVIFIVWIFVCIWVYKDANKRGMNGVLWLIVVLVASLIGLIIYLVIRRDHPIGGAPPMGYYPPPQYPQPGYYPPPQQYPQAPGQYPPPQYPQQYPQQGQYPPQRR